MKQTAVEWLEYQLDILLELYPSQWEEVNKSIEQAKELEKQQQGYSEEEVENILIIHTIELFKKEPITLENFWNKFKKK